MGKPLGMIDEKKETSQETASKPAPDWVKNKMTVSLSAANLKEVQAYVAGLPESEGVDNVSKLLLHLLLLAETSGDLYNLSVETAQREIKERSDYIFELQTEFETCNAMLNKCNDENTQLVNQLYDQVRQIEELQRQVAETSNPDEKNKLETSSKPTVKSWFWQENLK